MVVIHKMIERLGLEGGFEDHLVPTPKVSSVSTSGLFLYKMQPIVCGVLSSSRSSSKHHRVRAHHSLHWNKPSSLFWNISALGCAEILGSVVPRASGATFSASTLAWVVLSLEVLSAPRHLLQDPREDEGQGPSSSLEHLQPAGGIPWRGQRCWKWLNSTSRRKTEEPRTF